jgi:hypothetical protein
VLEVPSPKTELCPRVISACLHLFCKWPLPKRLYCANLLLSSFSVIKTACKILSLSAWEWAFLSCENANACRILLQENRVHQPFKVAGGLVWGWMRNNFGCEKRIMCGRTVTKTGHSNCCTEERRVSHMSHLTKKKKFLSYFEMKMLQPYFKIYLNKCVHFVILLVPIRMVNWIMIFQHEIRHISLVSSNEQNNFKSIWHWRE